MSYPLQSYANNSYSKSLLSSKEREYPPVRHYTKEEPKLFICRSWWRVICKAAVHILPIAITITLAVVNGKAYIQGIESTKYLDFAFQLGAKSRVSYLQIVAVFLQDIC